MVRIEILDGHQLLPVEIRSTYGQPRPMVLLCGHTTAASVYNNLILWENVSWGCTEEIHAAYLSIYPTHRQETISFGPTQNCHGLTVTTSPTHLYAVLSSKKIVSSKKKLYEDRTDIFFSSQCFLLLYFLVKEGMEPKKKRNELRLST